MQFVAIVLPVVCVLLLMFFAVLAIRGAVEFACAIEYECTRKQLVRFKVELDKIKEHPESASARVSAQMMQAERYYHSAEFEFAGMRIEQANSNIVSGLELLNTVRRKLKIVQSRDDRDGCW